MFSPDSTLTAQQNRIINLLAAGNSVTEAAAQEEIHRNTIGYWRRTQPNFARELEFAIREQRLYWHEQATRLAPQALAVINDTLTNPGSSPALRFRAAALILKLATDPHAKAIPHFPTLAPEMEAVSGQIHALRKELLKEPREDSKALCTAQSAPSAQNCTKPAEQQIDLEAPNENFDLARAADIVVAAQSCTKPQPIRVPPQPGRNQLCPCGSGIKYKRCCIARAQAA
jgi:hypothetical protein